MWYSHKTERMPWKLNARRRKKMYEIYVTIIITLLLAKSGFDKKIFHSLRNPIALE